MCLFSFVSAFFFHITREGIHDHRLQYYINPARTLLLAAEVTRVFVFFTLFPAHTFLILILQTASYTHACWLTLISGGCGVLWLTRVLHTMLNRPGTRSNRLGPDPDPADLLKYRPKPVRVPGPPWRPLPSGPGHWKWVVDGYSSMTMTQNTRPRQQRSGSRRSTLRPWSGLASLQTLIPKKICGGSWRFELPNISLETLMTWRGSAKRSGTKSLLRCVQTWWSTTRNVWPLWLPTRVLPPSTKSCFEKGSNTYLTH